MKTHRCWSRVRFVRLLVLLILVAPCFADPVLPTLFSDHMVLQQGREILIWGTGDPGEVVSASLAGNSSSVTAGAQGNWRVHLPSLSAGGPFTLLLRGKKEVEIKDVMIGEVWVASGQSNMAFPLDGAENAVTELPKANNPQIRLFTVPKKIALSPQVNTLPAHWEICSPDTAKSFSAVAYFFAREIQRKLDVPVGIIESAWPGTAIQAWMAPEVLRGEPDLKTIYDEWDRSSPEQKEFARRSLPLDSQFDDFELLRAPDEPAGKSLASFDTGTSRLTTGGSFTYSWTEAADTTMELVSPGHGPNGFALRITGKLNGASDSILGANYASDGSPQDLRQYVGIRFWVRGNGSFRFRSKQPTITDYDDYAAPVLKATPEWRSVTVLFHDLKQDGWGVVNEFTPDALTGFSIECMTALEDVPMPVSGLYEGMITPLLNYQLRGALWYQGESNAWNPLQYRKLLPALIKNWREDMHNPELDFLIVQLPNHGAIPEEPGESAWAVVREAQLMTAQKDPHTGLAVTIDVGEPKDLHPHRKMEVGERLARWALGTTYQQHIEYSGPLYESFAAEGNTVRVNFSHIGLGLGAQGATPLQGFAIAGRDHKFYWANARIEGSTVILSSPEVPQPQAVRYAWGDSPRCNLFNKDGLPASPFRTDDWPVNAQTQ